MITWWKHGDIRWLRRQFENGWWWVITLIFCLTLFGTWHLAPLFWTLGKNLVYHVLVLDWTWWQLNTWCKFKTWRKPGETLGSSPFFDLVTSWWICKSWWKPGAFTRFLPYLVKTWWNGKTWWKRGEFTRFFFNLVKTWWNGKTWWKRGEFTRFFFNLVKTWWNGKTWWKPGEFTSFFF